MKEEQMEELLYQALQVELGGVEVYQTALRCVQNEDLKEEWEEYLEHTKRHVEIVQRGLSPSSVSTRRRRRPGRAVVRHIGESLVKAMEMALESGPPEAAEIVAAECVVLRRDEGPPRLGADRPARRQGQGRDGQGAAGRLQAGRGPGRRAPVPHDRLEP